MEGTAGAKALWQREHGRGKGLKRLGLLEYTVWEWVWRISRGLTRLGLAGPVKAMEGIGFRAGVHWEFNVLVCTGNP